MRDPAPGWPVSGAPTMAAMAGVSTVAAALRARLGPAAAKVPTAAMPDLVFRGLAAVSPQMKGLLPLLGRTQAFSHDKARRLLGYAPRPPRDTVADCGASLVEG
ncbi:hypothetical protein ACO2Q3_15390 [Caulobacter sp. KR2-114]|uniref:hypothetical protein n=1 Tax=Caulobacter sp. KR2-114 TaxID=3400912 RepID=UPI003BFD79EB